MSIKYGLCNAHYAKILSTGNFAVPTALPGAVSLTLDDLSEFKMLNATGIEFPVCVKGAYKSGELSVVSLPLEFFMSIFEFRKHGGVLVEGKTVSKHFALLFESNDCSTPERFVFYDCIALLPGFQRSTVGESVEIADSKMKIAVSRPLARLIRGYDADFSASVLQGDEAFDTWFDEVYLI